MIPTVEELLNELHNVVVFSKLALRSGFNQIQMHPNDTNKTAFHTHDGHYEFIVMLFELSNAPFNISKYYEPTSLNLFIAVCDLFFKKKK